MKKIIFTLTMLVMFGSSYAQQDNKVEFSNKSIEVVYTHYLELKNALISSDFEKSKQASTALVNASKESKATESVLASAQDVSKSENLVSQRKAFTALSNIMTELVKKSEIKSGEIFLEYCPMANSNTGGYWLSNEKTIRNPYFGSSMLSCGSVKETIK